MNDFIKILNAQNKYRMYSFFFAKGKISIFINIKKLQRKEQNSKREAGSWKK